MAVFHFQTKKTAGCAAGFLIRDEQGGNKCCGAAIAPGLGLDEILGAYEREIISTVLERNRFSINKTAEQLKMTRHALRYRMQRLNLNPDGAAEDDTEGRAS